ncbi:hypothetical protein GCM10027614_38170 [Micromonospora vulcania]
MRVEVGVPTTLVAGLHRGEVRVERRLGVHHHRPATVQSDHQIRADHLLVGGGGDLLGEVAVLQHAGRLDDPAQLVLAPAAPHLRRAQRGHQLLGLGA